MKNKKNLTIDDAGTYDLDTRTSAIMFKVTGIKAHRGYGRRKKTEAPPLATAVADLVGEFNVNLKPHRNVDARRFAALRKLLEHGLLRPSDDYGAELKEHAEAFDVELALGGGYVVATEPGRRATLRHATAEYLRMTWDSIAHDVPGDPETGEVDVETVRDLMCDRFEDAGPDIRAFVKDMDWRQRGELLELAFPDGSVQHGREPTDDEIHEFAGEGY